MTRIECKNPAFHLVLQTFIWHACLDVVVLWVLQPTWMSCCMSNKNHCAMERCNKWRLCTAGYKSHLLDPHIQEGAFKPIYGQTNVWNCQENHLCIQVFHNWWKKPEKISPTCVNQSWGHYNTSIVKHNLIRYFVQYLLTLTPLVLSQIGGFGISVPAIRIHFELSC